MHRIMYLKHHNRQPYAILGEIPLWIAVVGVILFILIVKGLYNPYA